MPATCRPMPSCRRDCLPHQKSALQLGKNPSRYAPEEMQDGFCPRTGYGAAEGGRRAKLEDDAATKPAARLAEPPSLAVPYRLPSGPKMTLASG